MPASQPFSVEPFVTPFFKHMDAASADETTAPPVDDLRVHEVAPALLAMHWQTLSFKAADVHAMTDLPGNCPATAQFRGVEEVRLPFRSSTSATSQPFSHVILFCSSPLVRQVIFEHGTHLVGHVNSTITGIAHRSSIQVTGQAGRKHDKASAGFRALDPHGSSPRKYGAYLSHLMLYVFRCALSATHVKGHGVPRVITEACTSLLEAAAEAGVDSKLFHQHLREFYYLPWKVRR